MSLLRPRRVFIGFSNTASYYSTLAAGFHEIGYQVEYAAFDDQSPILRQYDGPAPGWAFKLFRLGQKLEKKRPGRISAVLSFAARLVYLLYCALRCDLFIFSSRTSFLPGFRDLAFLRLIGRRTIFTFLGSRSRPAFLNGVYTNAVPPISARRAVERAEAVAADLDRIGRLATAVIENPAAGQLHRYPFVNYCHIGFPNDLARRHGFDTAPRYPTDTGQGGQPVRILHAPSKMAVKGTELVQQMIADLRAEGLDVDLVLIHGLSNATVIDELRRCDFVIDQCFSDVPLAGFACEAAAFGKPDVVGGYAGPELDRFGPYSDLPTALYVHPDKMKDMVRRLVLDAGLRRDLGRAAQAFVLAHWSAAAVARRYIAVASGNFPENWRAAPQDLRYWQGCGAPDGLTASFIADMPAHLRTRALAVIASPTIRDQLADLSARD